LACKLLELAYENPFMPIARIFERIGNPTFSKQKAVRKEIEDQKLAVFEELRVGSTTMLLMGLLPGAFQLLKKDPLETRGRGSLSHRSMANWIAMFYARRDRRAHIEWKVPGTSHPTDVAVEAGDQFDLFEISVTCSDNLAQSIRACFANPEIISSVTIVAAQKAICKKLRSSVLSELLLFEHIDRVRFDVIENYLKELWQ